jgi:hypothetical protein
VHGVRDAVVAAPESRPTWIARDLRALLEDVDSLEPAASALRQEWAVRDGAPAAADVSRPLPEELAVLTA